MLEIVVVCAAMFRKKIVFPFTRPGDGSVAVSGVVAPRFVQIRPKSRGENVLSAVKSWHGSPIPSRLRDRFIAARPVELSAI